MKSLTIVTGIFGLGLTSLLGQQKRYDYCVPDSRYSNVLENDIAMSRFLLYQISQASARELGPGGEQFLAKIGAGAVYSLANTFSLRADWFHKCSLPQKEYFARLSENGAFLGVLLEATWPDDSPIGLTRALTRWRLKNPPLVAHGNYNDEIRGQKGLAMHRVIKAQLQAFAGDWKRPDLTNTTQVAALELLGHKLWWDERKFRPAPLFRVNSNSSLPHADMMWLITDFRPQDWRQKLVALADYYLPQ